MIWQRNPGPWQVPPYRNAGLRYRVWRVKWADFAGTCMTMDKKKFWTRASAEKRAEILNAIDVKS